MLNYQPIIKCDIVRVGKFFILYTVGCMFRSYSLKTYVLICAGSVYYILLYDSVSTEEDNIITDCSKEYFEENIASWSIIFLNLSMV